VIAGDRQVPAVTLLRWPDGSTAVAQAHVPVVLGPREARRLRIAPVPEAAAHPHWPGEWPLAAGADLPLWTEVEDPWGTVFAARLELDRELSQLSSPLLRVQRFRGVPRAGSGAAFLGVVAYLVMVRGSAHAELTLLLDNGAHLPELELGPVRLRSFSLLTLGEGLRFVPRFASENTLRPALPRAGPDGGYRQVLLGPSDQLYLGDRTAKAFRFDLFFADSPAGRLEEARAAAAVAARQRLLAWPDLDWVRRTGAFGLHGGPAPGGEDWLEAQLVEQWRASRFGPFTAHGDAEDAAAQGTRRNGPCALHDVLRWRSADLLAAAEAMVLQHTLRPTAGYLPRLPLAEAALRQGMSPWAIERPHGFSALDYEHFSVDLLYDFFWLTGDPLAHAELVRAGEGLQRLLEGAPFLTSRGEGWCLQGGVAIARATGDRELLAALLERARSRILPLLQGPDAPVAIAQPPHRAAFGSGEAFDAPWQMAALVHGLHALHGATGAADVAAAAVCTAHIMADAGWLEGKGPKYFVSARGAHRYVMPVGYEPLHGTAPMQLGAFALAAALTADPAERELFLARAQIIAQAHPLHGPDGALVRADRWFQLWLDRMAPPQ
jgi:hypothetical protein